MFIQALNYNNIYIIYCFLLLIQSYETFYFIFLSSSSVTKIGFPHISYMKDSLYLPHGNYHPAPLENLWYELLMTKSGPSPQFQNLSSRKQSLVGFFFLLSFQSSITRYPVDITYIFALSEKAVKLMILITFISQLILYCTNQKIFSLSFQLQFYVKQRFQITEGHHKQKLLKSQKYAVIFLLVLLAVSVILYLANGHICCLLWKNTFKYMANT